MNYTQIRGKTEPWYKHYTWARRRCGDKTGRYYKRGIKFNITIEEMKSLWFRDKAWLLEKPSIDRKDNNGNYIIDNCRFIELTLNSSLGNKNKKFTKAQSEYLMKYRRKPILQYDLTGKFIKKWDSIVGASKGSNDSISPIYVTLSGQQDSTNNNLWRYYTGGKISKKISPPESMKKKCVYCGDTFVRSGRKIYCTRKCRAITQYCKDKI